jgi:hypothetical protein
MRQRSPGEVVEQIFTEGGLTPNIGLRQVATPWVPAQWAPLSMQCRVLEGDDRRVCRPAVSEECGEVWQLQPPRRNCGSFCSLMIGGDMLVSQFSHGNANPDSSKLLYKEMRYYFLKTAADPYYLSYWLEAGFVNTCLYCFLCMGLFYNSFSLFVKAWRYEQPNSYESIWSQIPTYQFHGLLRHLRGQHLLQ